MTKRRKAYQERRKKQEASNRLPKSEKDIQEESIAVKKYSAALAKFKKAKPTNMDRWLANARKQFGIRMFNDIADDYNSKNK